MRFLPRTRGFDPTFVMVRRKWVHPFKQQNCKYVYSFLISLILFAQIFSQIPTYNTWWCDYEDNSNLCTWASQVPWISMGAQDSTLSTSNKIMKFIKLGVTQIVTPLIKKSYLNNQVSKNYMLNVCFSKLFSLFAFCMELVITIKP